MASFAQINCWPWQKFYKVNLSQEIRRESEEKSSNNLDELYIWQKRVYHFGGCSFECYIIFLAIKNNSKLTNLCIRIHSFILYLIFCYIFIKLGYIQLGFYLLYIVLIV